MHTTAVSRRDLLFMLNRLVDIDAYLIRTRRLPPLYESGVRYEAEREDLRTLRPVEDWQATDVLYERGLGDCEDLVCTRIAELRLRGIKAAPRLTRDGRILHVTVRVGNRVEDPSRLLGMRESA